MDSRLFLTVAGLFGAGALLIHLDHRVHGLERSRRHADWVKFGVFVPVVISLLMAAQLGRGVAAGVLGLIGLGGAIDIHRNLRSRLRPVVSTAGFLLFSFSLGHLLVGYGQMWTPSFCLLVVVVAATDAFSQLWGRLLGRHKLCPHLSPGKTVEGSVGGLMTAACVTSLLSFLQPGASWLCLVTLGLLTATGGVAGDLLFSAFKRAAGIKDFSGLLPGHGGVLDRFDSLIVAAPVYYWSRMLLLS